jgi:hypothetical protein
MPTSAPPASVSLHALYGRSGELALVPNRPTRAVTAVTAEVAARVDQALRAQLPEDLPSAYAKELYAVLAGHGLDRADLLAVAASLVDLVASDLSSRSDVA